MAELPFPHRSDWLYHCFRIWGESVAARTGPIPKGSVIQPTFPLWCKILAHGSGLSSAGGTLDNPLGVLGDSDL